MDSGGAANGADGLTQIGCIRHAGLLLLSPAHGAGSRLGRLFAFVDSVPDSGFTFPSSQNFLQPRMRKSSKAIQRKSDMPLKDSSTMSPMSFFHVPLVCEAASHIGCGTRARPVLAELEHEPGVREAWLNRDGTVLAILWAEATYDPDRVLLILHRHGVTGLELKGPAHERACDSFTADGWYRPMQMQGLSAEEARVIAARLVRRLEQKASVSAATAARLGKSLEDACARALAGASATSALTRREQIASALLDRAGQILEPAAFAAFQAVVSLGHRPLPGED